MYLFHFPHYYLLIVSVATVTEVMLLDLPCSPKQMEGGYVCVCNATYCDTLEKPTQLGDQNYILYSTSSTTPGFSSVVGTFQNHTQQFSDVTIRTISNHSYQTIYGVGGSFTDSFGINLRNLSEGTQDKLLRSYFSPEGIEYSLARVPVAGTDFSQSFYTYDDFAGDETLLHFNLTEADYYYKIPYIQRVKALSDREIKLLASVWTGPPWMKHNDEFTPGYLLPKYYQLYTDYLIKFLDAYEENNMTFWGMTTGNEVVAPFYVPEKDYNFNNMMSLPQLHRIWYKNNLGPSLQKSKHKNIKVIMLDDQRMFMQWWTDRIMSDKEAAKYVDGVALHTYLDKVYSSEMLDIFHDTYPNLFIINTEFCIIAFFSVGGPHVNPGAWDRGAFYAENILENLNHWSIGYIDWNMALNMVGGPKCNGDDGIDAAILVNAENDEFYKNPIFYVLGHFSKFISNGSIRIESLSTNGLIHHLATKNADGSTSVFLHNPSNDEVKVLVKKSGDSESCASFTVQANSMNTLVYW